MDQKILLTYASRGGSTQGVAHAIGAELVKQGLTLDIRYLLDVKDIKPYDVVIIGAPIRMGHWLSEAQQFLTVHQNVLKNKKVALFVVCMTLHEDTPENRAKVLGMMQPTLALVDSIDTGLFAGAMRPTKLKFFWRLLARITHVPEGDFRDYEIIRAWARGLASKLMPPTHL
ncbi:flavodoxin domain-containing protein [Thioflexithrix psekupsensis]|uniref:Flavodoxin-like domain-containing protein n=1 Tax=Thioflexithrix psekupsensis TaxID=1570016 RepID=A0A251X839_9GAMM|nr:flavodoxin domain-containing protein [Thioflexithrix psekupsensis]OUD14131.1 hypothetical protein TPSD3_07290 [Thioflexithrix psekupsensis]